MDLGIWVIIAALVGAKALLFIVDFSHFTSSWQEFTTLLRSGGVFYGGLIAAIVVCIYQLRKHRLPLWSSGDLFAPGIALGYMVGRLGCLMAGCCYGKPTDVPWAMTFTDPAAPTSTSARRSTCRSTRRSSTSRPPAWSSWSLLLLLERRGRAFPGRTFWIFVLLYGVLRFIIEFYRGDDRGVAVQRAVDLAVHLGRARAAEPVHAVVSEPARAAGRPPSAARGPRKPRFA